MPWSSGTSERSQRLPPDWKARCKRVMRRDRGVCHVCGEDGSDRVDHIVAGDDHDESNLAPIHETVPPYCHRYKSSAEGLATRRAMSAQRRRPAEPHPLDQKGP